MERLLSLRATRWGRTAHCARVGPEANFAMRRFQDQEQRLWDVIVGRESWGAYYALFVPAGPGRAGSVRQAPLEAGSYEAAQLELDALDHEALELLFLESTPKTT